MAETLIINAQASKAKKYEQLLPQLKAMVQVESDLIANLANVSSALKYGMGFFWVGFYLVKEGQLVLGPFQGPIACTRIAKGKGVCGKAWEENKTLVVDDVDAFPGHIACSSASNAEIVIPIEKNGEVVAVLDVDSDQLADFDETDKKYLEELVNSISF